MNSNPSEESLLISQFQSGNTRALSTLYDKYSGALYGVIIRICKDEAQAQDLLQETFITLWDKAKEYDSKKGRFYTWAYRIAKNKTLNAIRNTQDLIQNDDLGVYTNRGAEEINEVDLPKLNGAIKSLEAHHQQALELVYFQGLTHREAHKEMDVPLGTFKSYIAQALKKLREVYQAIIIWIALGIESLL